MIVAVLLMEKKILVSFLFMLKTLTVASDRPETSGKGESMQWE